MILTARARGVAILWVAAGVEAALAHTQPPPAESTARARIAYYSKRLGGAATYPAYAQLGLAYLEKARETTDPSLYAVAGRHLLASLSYQRNFEALLGAAMVCSDIHNFRQGRAYAEEAVAAIPDHIEAQGVLFDLCLALGDVESARAVADTLLALKPGFAAHSRQASLLAYTGDLPGAVQAMRRARQAAQHEHRPAPVWAWAEARLAALSLADCDYDQARAACQRSLDLQPDNPLALEQLAQLHVAQAEVPQAAAICERLLACAPSPRHQAALALLYSELGQADRADQARTQALDQLRRLAKNGSLAELRPLAFLLLERDETAPEGLEIARRDWGVRQDTLAADTLAWALYRNGRAEEGLPIAERALASGTKDPRLLLHAALIHGKLGHSDLAATLLRRAMECPALLSPAEKRVALGPDSGFWRASD